MGNGSFRFASRVEGESWTFEAHPHYPHGLGGRPYPDTLVIRKVPTTDSMLAELHGGTADYAIRIDPSRAVDLRETSIARGDLVGVARWWIPPTERPTTPAPEATS